MESKADSESGKTVDLRAFKEGLRRKLRSDSAVLMDLIQEPDLMPVNRAEVLIPHYLQRLEREFEKYEASGPLVLRP